jgi:betaine reductase
MAKFKVVHYINQFYGGIGGEEKADVPPQKVEGKLGPGLALAGPLGKADAEIVATIICGDTYFNENMKSATDTILKMVAEEKPDLFIAGPAFNAGRYGVACGSIASSVKETLGIEALTGMYIENPGADMFKQNVYIMATGNSAAKMRKAISSMASMAVKLLNKEPIGSASEEGYIPSGVRHNFFHDKIGAERAVDMLVKKLKGESFETEYPMPMFDRVAPVPPIKDLSKATIALVSSGGPVPKGNPDRIESSSASKYGEYSIAGIDDLNETNGETAHGGYDPTYANEDLDRVLPVDVMRDLEKEGKIGKLYDYYYTTVGNGTSVANAKHFAEEIAQKLKDADVSAVILTST